MRVTIEDFGQHEMVDFRVEDGEVMFGLGKNRVGKSTLRDAIEFALLGTCQIRGFRTKKDVGAYMIREGADSARVAFCHSRFGVRRSIRKSGASKIELLQGTTWMEVNATIYAEAFEPWTPEAVRVMLDAETFYRMEPEKRRELLIAVKGSEGIDADEIFSAFHPDVQEYAKEDAEREGRLRGLCEAAATVSFRTANTQAVEERRQAKRDLEAIQEKIRVQDSPGEELNGINVLRGSLEEQRARLDDLKRDLSSKESLAERAAGSYDGQIEEAQVALSRAIQTRDGLKGTPIHDGDRGAVTTKDARKSASAAKKELDACQKGVDRAGEETKKARDHWKSLEKQAKGIGAAPEHPGNCPAMSFEMKCPAKPATFVSRWEKLKGEGGTAMSLDERVEGSKGVYEEQKASMERAMEVRDEAADESKRQEALVRKCEDHDLKVEAAERAVEDAEARLSELQEARDDCEEGPGEDELEELRGKVAVGSQVVAQREAIEAWKLDHANLQTQANEIGLRIDWWDEIEKALKPDGIEAKLAAEAHGVFESSLETADLLAEVRLSDDLEVSINGRHIASCSKSEQLCGGIALQAAMAHHLRATFLVIDELDKLDTSWRKQFQAWAADTRSSWIGGMLALATTNSDPPGVPPEGFRSLWIRKGEKPVILGGEM